MQIPVAEIPAPPMRRWLEQHPAAVTFVWAGVAAFLAYFSMYAFRKPFSVARFDGALLLGTSITLKTAFGISQVVGYTLSKYVGVKLNSELTTRRRFGFLMALIGVAQVALLVFAVVPPEAQLVAILVNGLPLGMVWGVVVTYLEGRRSSEGLLAVLSVSFIVASGVVKDVGLWVLALGFSEAWMPAVVGSMFLLPFVGAVWMLEQVPLPTERDVAERCPRTPMHAADRWAFVRAFAPGLVALLVVYFAFTALRDFRDFFQREIVDAVGLGDTVAVFTLTEAPIALVVLVVLGSLSLIRDNRRALWAAHGIMLFGAVLAGASTWAFSLGVLGPMAWMTLSGTGCFLTYVPFGSVLFDRILAATRFGGTAVFAIMLCDAVGYTGSVGLKLFKDLGERSMSHLDFVVSATYASAALGVVLLVISAVFFDRRVVAAAKGA